MKTVAFEKVPLEYAVLVRPCNSLFFIIFMLIFVFNCILLLRKSQVNEWKNFLLQQYHNKENVHRSG